MMSSLLSTIATSSLTRFLGIRRRGGCERAGITVTASGACVVPVAALIAALAAIALGVASGTVSGIGFPVESCPLASSKSNGELGVGSPPGLGALYQIQPGTSCTQHVPQGDGAAPLPQLHMWLQCLASTAPKGQPDSGVPGGDSIEAWSAQVLQAVKALHHGALVASRLALKNVRAARNLAPAEAVTALREFASLEGPLNLAFVVLRQGIAVLGPRAMSGEDVEEELADMAEFRRTIRVCVVSSMDMARAIAAALPLDSSTTRRAMRCEPRLLAGLELTATREAEESSEPDVMFHLGMYLSSVCIDSRSRDVPFVALSCNAKSGWASGSGGISVPALIAQSEQLLDNAERLALDSEDRRSRAEVRAERLSMHALVLARLHHHNAAEFRYKAASQLAAKYGIGKKAATFLARLARHFYFLSHQEEALAIANEALRHDSSEPTARFLQVSTRVALGHVRTDAEAREASSELRALEGQLRFQKLESRRADLHALMARWQVVADSGAGACLNFHDSAWALMCLLGKVAFPA